MLPGSDGRSAKSAADEASAGADEARARRDRALALEQGAAARLAAKAVRAHGPPAGMARSGGASVLPPGLPLAQGDLDEEDARDLATLKRQIQDVVSFQCEGYKERCLRRRIAVRMRACGVHTYSDYSRLLQQDATEYERLVDTLTINVSKFFRNPEVWDVVRDVVLPGLMTLDTPVVNVWSAGAAGGEEPYTFSMLLQDEARIHGYPVDRFRILGTDIDRESLAFAARAEYGDFAMSDIDAATRERWFDYDGVHRLRPEARTHVSFGTLDLIRDEYPTGQHLIFCRNVIIYFERSIQEELFHKFHAALVPGGYLVLGKVEALFGAASRMFRTVANRQRVFRKS